MVGGVGQVAVQWPALRREGFRYRAVLDWRDPELRKVLLLMGPGTLGIAATQVNVFVNTLLATSEGTGAVSWLTYAFRLIYLPIGLFGVSIATAVLPAVSRYAAVDDFVRVRDTLSRGVSLMLMLSVPATFGLIVLATPIVQLLFQHGRFLPADTTPTAAALRFYAVGLIGYSTARIASPAFYALRQSRVPAIVSVCTIAANIVVSLALVRTLGFRGLALGTSLAALANGALLMLLLRRRLDGIGGGVSCDVLEDPGRPRCVMARGLGRGTMARRRGDRRRRPGRAVDSSGAPSAQGLGRWPSRPDCWRSPNSERGARARRGCAAVAEHQSA